MIRACDYCFCVFDEWYWSWCVFSNDQDNSITTLCSRCACEILSNQKDVLWIENGKNSLNRSLLVFGEDIYKLNLDHMMY